MKRNPVFLRYMLCLCILSVAFAMVFCIIRAQENSEHMRTGNSPQTVDYRDISEFIGERTFRNFTDWSL